ncbi:ribosome maturation factor RimM [Desulfovibrio inopinatus]|uniref:ribosome maturation factor RimM n=1 Tax=Desulfovibrio inopinatus TaxID=102109 RepID=UPI0004090235|nr:ribosome maturation factor RimM [Desulfovibrio inopinatus]
MTKTDYVVVGRVAKPHGIKGEFRIQSYADSPSFFSGVETIFFGSETRGAHVDPKPYKLISARPHKENVLAVVEGINDRNDAERLRGFDVFVRAEELPLIDDDEVYLHEIFGFDVINVQDNTRIGILNGVLEMPQQEVWSIGTDSGKEVLFPANEETVVAIDLDEKTVSVDPPEGLLELYL